MCGAVKEAEAVPGEPPLALTKIVKGKGVSLMGGRNTWCGKATSDKECAKAKTELRGAS